MYLRPLHVWASFLPKALGSRAGAGPEVRQRNRSNPPSQPHLVLPSFMLMNTYFTVPLRHCGENGWGMGCKLHGVLSSSRSATAATGADLPEK